MTTLNQFFAVLLMGSAAAGAPFYSNGLPTTSSGNEMTSRIQAEDFTINEGMTLTGVRFWAFYFTDLAAGYLGNIEWGIHADGGAQPGVALFSGLATPTLSAGATNCCNGIPALVDFGLSDVPLEAGTYWLTLHNGPKSETGFEDFYWQTTDPNATARGLEQAIPFGASSWTNTNWEHAFELDGATSSAQTVPEPGAFYLVGFTILALILHHFSPKCRCG